jgi:uncharacterized protein YjbI with pentapeptide repeats
MQGNLDNHFARITAVPPENWNALVASRRAKEEWITPTMATHWQSRYAGNLDTRAYFSDEWANWRALSGQDICDVDLSGRDLDGADFSAASLTNVTMLDAGLRAVNFSSAQLDRVNLSGSLIFGTLFCDAILHEVDFSNAYLYYCNFRGCRLSNARLEGARLCRVTQLSIGACQSVEHGR